MQNLSTVPSKKVVTPPKKKLKTVVKWEGQVTVFKIIVFDSMICIWVLEINLKQLEFDKKINLTSIYDNNIFIRCVPCTPTIFQVRIKINSGTRSRITIFHKSVFKDKYNQFAKTNEKNPEHKKY